MEIWKDIKDFNGYQVSNIGRVRTHNKITITKKHGIRHWEDRILKYKEKVPKKHSIHQGKNGKGYSVDLWKNGKPKTFLVARLVAFTFYEKDINNKSLTVDHIDGNRLNNNIDNLEIVSLQENIKRAYLTGLNTNQKSIKIINKSNDENVIFRTLTEASKYIGCNKGYLSLCVKKGKFNNDKYIWELV